jgi:hypothetical protein
MLRVRSLLRVERSRSGVLLDVRALRERVVSFVRWARIVVGLKL